MLHLLTSLFIYTENGHQYETNEKKVLVLVEEKTEEIQIPETVEKIVGGSISSSAFNMCKNRIKTVSFKPNSQLNLIGEMLFAESSIEIIDFTNCGNLLKISNGCCYKCNNLIKLVLPPNVNYIGSGAIRSQKLSDLTFPDSLNEIGEWDSIYGAPIECPNLKSVGIGKGSSLTKIGVHGFIGSGLESFFIPKKLASFGQAVFVGCPIKEFTVDPENQFFSTDGITVYNKDYTGIEFISSFNTSTDYVIRSSVTSIKDQAFRGVPTKTVIYTNQDINLNTGCFSYSGIQELTFPTGIHSVPSYCICYSSVRKVTLHSGIVSIENSAFMGCTSLREVIMSDKIGIIKTGAFNGCASLLSLVIPESVTKIEPGAFSSCNSNLQLDIKNTTKFTFRNNILYCDGEFVDYISDSDDYDIVIPKNINSIVEGMFQNKKLRTLTFEEGSCCTSIDYLSFGSSTVKTITFPPSLNAISRHAFKDCPRLETVNFDGTVTVISAEVFVGCVSLTTVNFKGTNQITTIKESAFSGCTSLNNFEFLELTKLSVIEINAFLGSGITIANFPNSLTSIGSSAFKGSKLQKLNFNNANITNIESYCFSDCSSLQDIEFSPLTQEIKIYAFSGCTSLTTISLGTGISVINRYAFSYSTQLSVVVLPVGSQLKHIMGNAFFETSLTSFDIKDKTQFSFKKGLLMNGDLTNLIYYISNKDVISVILPSTVVTVGDFAFQNAIYLREVIIPDGTFKKIGFSSFQGCTNLRRVSLPDTLENIENYAFDGCNRILCGGLYLKNEPQLIEKAKNAGIPQRALADGCLNNLKALIRDNTCKTHSFSTNKLCFFLFLVI